MRGWLSGTVALTLLAACGGGPSADFTEGEQPAAPAATTTMVASGAGGAGGALPTTAGAPGNAAGAAGATQTISSGPGGAPPAPSGAPGDGGSPAALPPAAPAAPAPSGLPDINFDMQSMVPPGGETLMCTYAQMPTDRGIIAVPSAESTFTPGSHHMLAYRTDLTEIPDGQTGVWSCEDGSWMIHARGSYYEAQQPESRRDLPPGVAHRFQPGEVVIIQTHYVNTSVDALVAQAHLTLHTVDVSTVPNEAGSIIFTDTNISIPPGGSSRSTMTCTLPVDFHPALLWSHMHKQGVNFVATTDDPDAAATLGTLYQETDWSEPHPRAYPFDPPVVLHAGTHITFSCDFQNPTSNTITFGQSAEKNEMCILHGMYWPRMTPSAEQCYGGKTSRSAVPE